MIYASDCFATIADIFGALPEYSVTSKTQIVNPNRSRSAGAAASPMVAGRAIGAKVHTPRGGMHARRSPRDDTASFREEMGIQDPQGALTMEELLDHESSVWVVLKQHNRVPSELLAVFGCPVNAQFYAKTHRGFQKRFESVTDMFDQMPDRGIIAPLRAAYNDAIAQRTNENATPATPEHRHKGKRSRIKSPGTANTAASGSTARSSLSSHGMDPATDLFARNASSHSDEWQFDHIDKADVEYMVGKCPPAQLEKLRQLLGIVTDPDFALTQVLAWRAKHNKNNNE
jgi:hypothetical protein